MFVIGADRISTDLHNLVVDTNATLAKPLTLDYEYNDPADPNSFYTRSDHYSYAVEGHPDRVLLHRHAPGLPLSDRLGGQDPVSEARRDRPAGLPGGFNVANCDQALERDNKGPRSGRGFMGDDRFAQLGLGRLIGVSSPILRTRGSQVQGGYNPRPATVRAVCAAWQMNKRRKSSEPVDLSAVSVDSCAPFGYNV